MDRFDTLQSFIAVVETGSFSEAAERLAVGKSVISRRVSALENRLGVQLLRRTTRRLSLTEAGREFYPRAARLLAELEEAEQAVAEGQRTLRGRLRLAAPLSFGIRHLGPALNAFMAEHPELVLDLDLDDREVNLVEEGVDVAVRIGRLDDSSLVAVPLFPVRILLCASPDYLARHGRPLHPRDLTGHMGLAYANLTESQQWHFIDGQGAELSVRVPTRLRANNGDVLLEAALAGLGIISSPSFIVHRALREGTLVPLLPGYRLLETTAYAIYPSRRFLPRRVRTLVEFLRSRFGDRPYWDEDLPTGPHP